MEKMQIVPDHSEDTFEKKLMIQRTKEDSLERKERYLRNVELVGEFIAHAIKNNGEYVEVYKLNDKNEIDRDTIIKDNSGRNILEMVNSVDVSAEGLGNLATDIVKNKNIKFSVKVENGQVILKFENIIKKGSLVNWVSQGAVQWDAPRKIIEISDDGKWVFVEEGTTGIPISQLEIVG